MPFNVQHKVHVNFDYEWSGEDPKENFQLVQVLGEGYVFVCSHS